MFLCVWWRDECTDPDIIGHVRAPTDFRVQSPQPHGPVTHTHGYHPQPRQLEEYHQKCNLLWTPESQPHYTSLPYSIRKTVKMLHFQGPIANTRPQRPSLLSRTQPKPALKTPMCSGPKPALKTPTCSDPNSALKTPNPSSPNPGPAEATNTSIALAQDIVAFTWAFPCSFNTIGNMPSTYTIRTDPSIHPVQHTCRKVPIVYWEQMEFTLNDMVAQGVIATVSACWVGIFPHIPPQAWWLPMYMPWPKDLNKATVREHYKAPTVDEISHWLSSATCFNKLDVKDCFWSIHLNEKSSYLMTSNTPPQVQAHAHAIWPDNVPGHLPDAHRLGNGPSP